jgi:uncharacterized protein with von Willebrand factor type A (vWA) domain
MSEIIENKEIARRWRLILGGESQEENQFNLSADDIRIDKALSQLYNSDDNRKGGLGKSKLQLSGWLGDIREYFPKTTVQIMQKDAMERLNLKQLLLEPEVLETIEADVNLVATLLDLKDLIPEKTKETAREVVRQVVEELLKKLSNPTRQAINGSLNRAVRNMRPRSNEIDWHRTILKNIKTYQPEYQSIIPERLVGYSRTKRPGLKEVILCVDQSGSMATSVVYAGIFGAVMSSMPALKTKMVVFDTQVADLSENLSDPIELLFSTQLGGGTNINNAVAYCEKLISRPKDTIFVLITDLYEWSNPEKFISRLQNISTNGSNVICLLALNNEGKPYYDRKNASTLAGIGILSFACSPDKFPDLMAAAINNQDIQT